jgi:hypothetical protein
MGDMRTFAAQTEATTTVHCQKNSGWTNNQIDLHQFLQVAPKRMRGPAIPACLRYQAWMRALFA